MRLSSPDLHALVQSFTANEKMLFKRFNASAKESAAYLLLFDVLAAMKIYDEEKLKAQLAKRNPSPDLKSLKGYLYEQLMLFLRVNVDTKNKLWQMRQLNTDADILMSKGLRRNALELHKEHLAASKTMSNPLREIIALDNIVGYAHRTADPLLLQEYELLLEKKVRSFLNEIEAEKEFRKVAVFYGENYPIRDQQTLRRLKQLGKTKFMQSERNVHTPLAHLFYYNFYVYFHYMLGDFEKAFHFAAKRYKYIKSHHTEFQNAPMYQMSTLEIMIGALIKAGRFEEALRYYNELKAMEITQTDIRGRLLVHACFVMLNANFEWTEATRQEREKSLQFLFENKNYSPVISDSLMRLAYACFRHKEYNTTLTLLNEIISEKYAFRQSVLQTEARVLGILTHYQMKNYLLIEYLINNTKRYLRHEKKLYPFEYAIMNGIRHLPEKINERDVELALLKWKNNLQEITKNPFERNAMGGFDFVGWIDKNLNPKAKAV